MKKFRVAAIRGDGLVRRLSLKGFGTIGIAPSGNLNPERLFPSMFEPVHGSAPDIAGEAIVAAVENSAQASTVIP